MGDFVEYMFATPVRSVVVTFLAIAVLVIIVYIANELSEMYDNNLNNDEL